MERERVCAIIKREGMLRREREREGKGRRFTKTGKGGKECLGLHYGREGGKETYYYGKWCQGKVKDEGG